MKRPIILILLFTIIHTITAQQTDARYDGKKVFPFGIIETIDSQALSEKRTLNIYLPDGYRPDSLATYPTIYVLDGSANEDFPHIAGLVQFMNMYNLLPKSIVVGIANVDRYRDFTSPSSDKRDKKSLPTSGGSQRFISFLEKEVQPFIKNNFKTNGHKTIIGQSLGGLVATEILLERHYLFEDYIIVSPSLWWDNQKMINGAREFFKSNNQLKKRIFVSLGKEHPTMHEVADKLVNAIKDSGNKNIELFYEPILEEDHATILHSAVYRAFEKFNPKTDKSK